MSKYIHRAKALPAIPMDYWERFDASTSEGMTFNTNEATGDVSTWNGQCGRAVLTKLVAGTYPLWTPGQVYFDGDSGLQDAALGAPFDAATDCTVIMAVNFDSPSGTNYMYYGPPFTVLYSNGLSDKVLWSGGLVGQTAEDLLNTDIVVGLMNEHVGTNDNTKTYYLGTTEIASSTGWADASSFVNLLRLGYYSTSGNAATGNFYEIIVYDRLLSLSEYEAVCNYLSNKWSAQNSDTASADIETAPETVDDIPLDYDMRFDTSVTGNMTFTTDLATGDVATWQDERNNVTLALGGTGTAPVLTSDGDGQTALYFTEAGQYLSGSYPSNWDIASQLSAGEGVTQFAVLRAARADQSDASNRFCFSGPFEMIGPLYDSADGPSFFASGGYGGDPVNETTLDGKRLVWGNVLTHNTTDDNDVAGYIGVDNFATAGPYTDASVNGPGYVIVGGLNTGAESPDFYFYELIFYRRLLSAAEITKVANYLSKKWDAWNEDSATEVVYSGSTTRNNRETWTNSNIDPDGEGSPIYRSPGKQPGEYSIVRVGDREALYLDKNYPATKWGSKLLCWWDAADTGNMTFATGDAKSGGTVSSWTDRTGNYTANTTSSGDPAIGFTPNKRGRPCLQGDGASTSIETGNITVDASTGNQKIYWTVNSWNTTSATQTCIDLRSLLLGPRLISNYNNDLYPGVNHHTVFATGKDRDYIAATTQDASEGIYVSVWLTTRNGSTDTDISTWLAGMKIADENTANAGFDSTLLRVSFGSAGGLIRSDGDIYEAGIIDDPAGTITEADVEELIRYLCEKYDVDYMPDTTPMDIGLHARSTTTVAQTDCALWYRSDKNLSEAAWGLHPKCAALHTTPSNFAMKAYANPGEVVTENSRKAYRALDTSPATSLVQGTNYNAAETTDFPADTDGCSSFGVKLHDSVTTTSSGSMCVHYTGYTRFNGTSNTIVQHYESNAAKNWTAADAWFLFGGVYHYDSDGSGGIGEAGTPDGTPYVWYIANDITPQEQDAPAATSFNTKMSVGSNTTGALPGAVDCSELFLWKHPLTSLEISNLKRYVNWRYGLGLTP